LEIFSPSASFDNMLSSLIFVALAVVIFLVPNALCSAGFKVSQVASASQKIRPGGPASLARTYGKYGLPISKSLAEAAAAQLKGQTGSSSADLVDYEIMYATPITIGGQEFNIQFDTGSSAM
jgi:hypothetical protein